MKDIVNSSKNLINQLSAIEERHLLEFLAVDHGIKDIMRIHIANDKEFATLTDYCLDNSFHLTHSSFKLKLEWSNEIGDKFYSYTEWDDQNAEEYIAYFTKDKLDLLKLAEDIEIEGSHTEAGLLYGYPKCCCLSYEEISNGKEWISVLSENSTGLFFSPFTNKLAYLVHGYTLFPDYFPCAYDCEYTASISREYYELGKSYNLNELVDNILYQMSGVYMVSDTGVISFSDWKIEDDNIILDLNNLKYHGKNNLSSFEGNILKIKLPLGKEENLFWKWDTTVYRIFIFINDKKYT